MSRPWEKFAPWLALLVCAVARLPGLILGVEHYGDAPVRVEIAQRWAASPHLFRGFSETYQYGPLHLALLGGALRLWPNRLVSPRLLSFIFALAGVWILYWLAKQVTSTVGALLAATLLSLDTVHIQAGSSAASEAIFLTMLLGTVLIVWKVRESAAGAAWRLVAAGFLIGLASLVRYDGVLYAALLTLLLTYDWALGVGLGGAQASPRGTLGEAATGGSRRDASSQNLLQATALVSAQSPKPKAQSPAWFALAAAIPIAWWLAANHFDSGDWLAPIHHVDLDHRALADQGLRWFGPIGYRLYCLFYWPVNLLVLSSPLFGIFSLSGSARALWARSRGWELAALAWIPAAYFTYRGAVRADFRPMSRFVLMASALTLPFAWDELLRFVAFVTRHLRMLAARETSLRRSLASLGLALAIATPLFFFTLSYGKNGNTAEWARPLSPVSSVPPGIAQAARFLREHATPDDQILLDGVWDYLEIPLAFESNLPETQFTRLAYDNFEAKLKKVTPTMAVLLYQGNLQFLADTKNAIWQSPEFDFRGQKFCRAAEFVYAGVYTLCSSNQAPDLAVPQSPKSKAQSP